MKKQRILTFYFENKEFAGGPIDVTARLSETVPEDQMDNIKYIMQSSNEQGVHVSVVMLEKKEVRDGVVGFGR